MRSPSGWAGLPRSRPRDPANAVTALLVSAALLTGASGAASAGDQPLTSVTVASQSGTLTYGKAGTATYMVTVTRRIDTGTSSSFSVTLSQIASLPPGANVVSFVPSTLVFASGETSKTSTLTMSSAPSTPASATSIQVQAAAGDDYVTGAGTLGIQPATATVKANDKTKVYGDPIPVLDATVTGEVPGDPIQYTLSTTATPLSNVATSPYPITVTLGANPNYTITTADGDLFVNLAEATVKANPKTKIYGDPVPPLDAVVTGQVPGGDPIQYSLSTPATALSGVSGNPYPINVTLGANPNYSVKVLPDNGTLTVLRKPATVTANNKTKLYGDPNPQLDAVVTGEVQGGDPVRYTLSTTATQLSNVGPYLITVTLLNNPNYNVTQINGALMITPRPASVTANNKSKIYGDPIPLLDATVIGEVKGGELIHYSLSTTATPCSDVAGSPYAIVVTLGLNPNYKVTANGGLLTVTIRSATVTANDATKTYGDENPTFAATVTGEAAGCEPIHYTLSTTAVRCSSVGPYPIKVTLGANPNYNVTPIDGVLTIEPRHATIKANPKTKFYGDDNPPLDATVTNEAVGCEPIHYTLSTAAVKCSNVGTYDIFVTLGFNPNYAVKVLPDNGVLTILPRQASVIANNKTKTYGDPNPPLDATVINEAVGCDPIHYTLATTAVQCSNVGSYVITVTLGSNPNYIVTPTGGALTVLPRVATVKPNCKTKTYGDPNPVLDAVVTNEATGCEPVHYTLSTPAVQCSNVGSYPILVTLGSNPNYSVKVLPDGCGGLTILPRVVTIQPNCKTKIYGDPNPPLDAVVTNEAPCEPVHYSLSTPAVQCSDVAGSPYPIFVTVGSNPNYSVKVLPAPCGLTVVPRDATILPNCKTKTYGDPNPLLDAIVTGEAPGCEPVHYTLSTTALQCSDVAGSPYPILVTLLANPNYSVKVLPITCGLTIVPRNATIMANNKFKTYGDPNPVLDAVVTGEAPGCEPIHYMLSTTAVQCSDVAGSPYPILVTLLANPNYSVKVLPGGVLNILPRIVSIKINDKTKTYGDPNPALDAVVTNEAVKCEPVHYTLSTTAVQCSPVSGNPYPITITLGANPNYSVKVLPGGVLTILPRVVTITIDPKSKAYGDPNPPLTATVINEATGCELVHYTLATPAVQCSDVAGSPYVITITLGSNPNYSVKVLPGGLLTVVPRVATIRANSKSKTYGDPNPPLDATVINESKCEPVHYTLSTPAVLCSDVAGSPYPILVTPGANPNYSVQIAADNGTLTIVPRCVTVTINSKSKVYGDPNPPFDAVVTNEAPSCEPFHYTLSTLATQCSDVGSYLIIITPGPNPNYCLPVPPSGAPLIILPRHATVTANKKSRFYGDPDPIFDATVTNEAVGCEPVHYTLSTTATHCSDVADGPFAIIVTLGLNPNYDVTPQNGELNILPRPAKVTASNATMVYGDPIPTLEATVTGEVADCERVHYSLSTTALMCSDVVGSPYPITVALGTNPNYVVSTNDGALTVVPRAVKLQINNKTKVYGDPNPALDATIIGGVVTSNAIKGRQFGALVEGLGCEPIHYTLSTTATKCSDVAGSPYPITAIVVPSSNYEVTVNNGALTVLLRPATVTANNKSKIYGDPNPALDATVGNEAAGCEPVHYTLSTAAAKCSDVKGGPYPITVVLGLNPNYIVTPINGVLAVTPRPATVTANNKSKTYGDPNPPLDATVGNEAAGCEPVHYTLSTAAVKCSDVKGSPYPITVILGANPNYIVTPTNGGLTILQRVATVTANNKTKVFGDPVPPLDATVSNEAAGCEPVHYTLSTTATQNSTVTGSPYPIIVTLLSNPNYNVTAVNGLLTVTPATALVTLTASPNPVEYDDEVKFTATVANGFLSGVKALSAVTVVVGAKSVGTITLAPSGSSLTGSLYVEVDQAPGLYTVTGLLVSVSPDYSVVPPAAFTLTLTPDDDAIVNYTGAIAATTTGAPDSTAAAATPSGPLATASNSATITLSATIRDTAAAGSFRDVRNARVTFVDRGNGDAPIATVPVGLVSAGDTKTGTATYDWVVDVGAATSKQFTVGVVVSGYYTRNRASDNIVVTVSRPNANSITGTGSIVLSRSSGLFSGDSGSKCDFDISLQYKTAGSLGGKLTTTLKRGGRSYRLEATTLASLATQKTSSGGTATFTGRANLVDVTVTGAPVTIDGDAVVVVTLADGGASSTSDWIAISVLNKKGGLWFSSNWDGSSTTRTSLSGGYIQLQGSGAALLVRAGATRPEASQPGTTTPAAMDIPAQFALSQNYPNPFTANTTLRFDLPEPSRVTLTIYDVSGREVERLVDGVIGPGRHVATWSGRNQAGRPAEAGLYFVRMIATSQTGTSGLRADRRIALVR